MLNLVTDRTNDDVISRNEKGTYNAKTLNRVENATRYICDILSECGYYTTLNIKNNWKEDKESNYIVGEDRKANWNTIEQMDRYLNNVKKCVSQFAVMKDTESLPETINYLNYKGANIIEKSLQDIEVLVGNMKKEYRYAGTFFSGRSIYDDVELEFLKKSIYDTGNVSTDVFGYINNQINNFKNQVKDII